MTTVELPAPGELFEAQDGNYNRLTDARFPAPDEPTDFILDANGVELRKGDLALVIASRWGEFVGKIVEITSVQRGLVYKHNFEYVARAEKGTPPPWSPSNQTNTAYVTYRKSSTGMRPSQLRRIELTDRENARRLLIQKLDDDMRVTEQMANLEAERLRLRVEIRELQARAGDVE